MSALHRFADAPASRPPRQFMQAPAVSLVRSPMVMPQQRQQRIAARRVFVDMKCHFIEAVAGIEGRRGDWLRHQVRQTEAPIDLWLLRGAVYAALGGRDALRCQVRLNLHQALDSVFPDSSFTPLAPR
jgi:hypothetical protein